MSRISVRWIAAARESLRGLLFRNQEEAELGEELRFHMEMEAKRLQREEGLDALEAQRRAAVAFGGVERTKSDVRDARGLAWVPGTWLDFNLGARMLRKYPALALVGGLGMAVAIAISVGFFAFAQIHAFPTLPLEEGDRIVALENRNITINNEDRRVLHDFVMWRDELKSIQDLAAFRTVSRNLIIGEEPPTLVQVAEMTANGFKVARVRPVLGRYLLPDDERIGAPPVLVIGYDVWQSRFAGNPNIVGREVRFGSTVLPIIGVMPKEFGFPISDQYWIPMRPNPNAFARRDGPSIYVFGRLAPGVTMEQAQAELTAVGQRTAAEFPESNKDLRPMVMPYIHSLTDIQGLTAWTIVQMELMMSLLLVVVALNVAVLVYARTATRQGEIAVRTALGASRARIIMQLFMEALVLSLGASAVGLALAQVGLRLGNKIMEQELGAPFWMNYRLQPATVLFTVGVAVFAALIVGVLPALQATGRRVQDNLRQLGGSTGMQLGKTWTVLIVAQIAIAVAALPAAVSMGWREIRNATTRPIYASEEFLLAELAPEPSSDATSPVDPEAKAAEFGVRLTELMRRLRTEPSVAGATWTTSIRARSGSIEIEGKPATAESQAGYRVSSEGVSTGFLDLYGASILTGRAFVPADMDTAVAQVIVNRTFAQTLLGGENVLGRRIRWVAEGGGEANAPVPLTKWFEIIGVAEDLEVNDFDPRLVPPRLYYPVAAHQASDASLEVRLRPSITAADFAPKLREITAAVDPTLRLGTTYSLEDFERQERLALRLIALSIGLVLLSVFLLSAAGVYALMSFTVTKRRREIGIRTALGAHPDQVLRTVFARVARQVLLGVVCGIGAALVVERLSGGELLGGRAGVLLPVFAVLMGVVATLAAIGPARRALGIEPTEALRAEG
jgi:predicted permease